MNRGFVLTTGWVILIAIGLLTASVATGYIRVPEGGGVQIGGTTYGGPEYITYEQYEAAGNVAPEGARVDLRDIAYPALEAYPDVGTWCTLAGGTWHWEDSWIGCAISGYPEYFAHCDTNEAVARGAQLCGSLGATPVCNTDQGVYCKY